MAKERLDVILVKRNLSDTREKAKRMIMAGLVFSENKRLDKAGVKVDINIPLHIKGKLPYVGRGGLKLEKALKEFNTTVNGKTIVDIGSSTGGFSDCALQNGAKYIYAIDVGYNQLAWKLRNHPQVEVHERTNFRHVTKNFFENGIPDFAMMDVSFISLRLILPVLKETILSDSDVIALIKPQFEAQREEVGKKGIIRDKQLHKSIVQDIITFAGDIGFSCENITYSPIKGGEGNIEFLAHFRLHQSSFSADLDKLINQTVETAHEMLKK